MINVLQKQNGVTLKEHRKSKRIDRTITPWKKVALANLCDTEEKWILRKLGPAILLLQKNYETSNQRWAQWVAQTYGYETT